MTEPDEIGALARRNLLRGGAVLAGAAGLSAVGAALAPKASATDGQALLQGRVNTGATTTTVDSSSTAPALTLSNAQNGSLLELRPRADIGENETLDLEVGEIINTAAGPYIGISGEGGKGTAYLATNFDLDLRPYPAPLDVPARVLDTRYVSTRIIVRASSNSPFDSTGRVRAGVWIDVAVDVVNPDYVVDGAFFNLIALGAANAGYLTAYPPIPDRPVVSVVNYVKTAISENGVFARVGLVQGEYVVRIFTSQTTHILLNLTGETLLGPTAPEPDPSGRRMSSRQTPKRFARTPRRH